MCVCVCVRVHVYKLVVFKVIFMYSDTLGINKITYNETAGNYLTPKKLHNPYNRFKLIIRRFVNYFRLLIY